MPCRRPSMRRTRILPTACWCPSRSASVRRKRSRRRAMHSCVMPPVNGSRRNSLGLTTTSSAAGSISAVLSVAHVGNAQPSIFKLLCRKLAFRTVLPENLRDMVDLVCLKLAFPVLTPLRPGGLQVSKAQR
ncbi:exported hypothetical protein [Mesorhizobium plurifarium]|uniref:Uncharacterized protein n=1 Tax=Mesorhizobium plurifarium TaxID=69974 RepID=A0A0K2VQG9_MESPL|nr:exported hypothetical protein [Mesorhizobium plurifarium]